MSCRKFWPELLGMPLYFSNEIYFYAWNWDHARKKIGAADLFVVDEYGAKHKARGLHEVEAERGVAK